MLVGDKILVKVGGDYSWCRVDRVDTETFTIPLYVCTVLEGLFKGYTVATPSYLDHAKQGQFISHELPEECNA